MVGLAPSCLCSPGTQQSPTHPAQPRGKLFHLQSQVCVDLAEPQVIFKKEAFCILKPDPANYFMAPDRSLEFALTGHTMLPATVSPTGRRCKNQLS